MTNKERYKQAFSVLHTSDQFSVEVENMSRLNKKHNMKVAAAVLAGCILLAGGTGTAYAANVGGTGCWPPGAGLQMRSGVSSLSCASPLKFFRIQQQTLYESTNRDENTRQKCLVICA